MQALRFHRNVFTRKQAGQWAKEQGYPSRIDTAKTQYRIRVQPPEAFKPGSFRTITFRPGLTAIIGCPTGKKVRPMAKKKKKATKKRANPKRNPPKKKATATKKDNPKRKRKAAVKSITIELKLSGDLIHGGKSRQKLYHAYLKQGGEKISLGNVTAPNQTAARKKARTFVRGKIG